MTAAQRSERLAMERGRVLELTDPVAKTRSYIMISNLLLQFAYEVVRDDELGDLDILLQQYLAAIRNARETIVNSREEGKRRPDGYNALASALGAQLLRLQEMQNLLFEENHKPIEDTRAVVTSIRSEVLRLVRN
jgi:hypothetical protein